MGPAHAFRFRSPTRRAAFTLAIASLSPGCDPTDETGSDAETQTGADQCPSPGPVSGRLWVPEANCLTELRPAGCTNKGICQHIFTVAADPDGQCWEFTSDCYPDGWTPDAEHCGTLIDVPPCAQ